MGEPAARKGDTASCLLPNHFGGPIDTVESSDVLIDNVAPVHRLDSLLCKDGSKNAVPLGAMSVMYKHRAAARKGDKMLHGGLITTGYDHVLIGDHKWSHAGESFPNQAAAAQAACDEANENGIPANKEYAGTVYYDPSTDSYGYSPPAEGTQDRSNPDASPAPDGTTPVGDYHCHGDYTDEHSYNPFKAPERTSDPANESDDADSASGKDQEAVYNRSKNTNKYPQGYTGYVGTPSGQNKSYDGYGGQKPIS